MALQTRFFLTVIVFIENLFIDFYVNKTCVIWQQKFQTNLLIAFSHKGDIQTLPFRRCKISDENSQVGTTSTQNDYTTIRDRDGFHHLIRVLLLVSPSFPSIDVQGQGGLIDKHRTSSSQNARTTLTRILKVIVPTC